MMKLITRPSECFVISSSHIKEAFIVVSAGWVQVSDKPKGIAVGAAKECVLSVTCVLRSENLLRAKDDDAGTVGAHFKKKEERKRDLQSSVMRWQWCDETCSLLKCCRQPTNYWSLTWNSDNKDPTVLTIVNLFLFFWWVFFKMGGNERSVCMWWCPDREGDPLRIRCGSAESSGAWQQQQIVGDEGRKEARVLFHAFTSEVLSEVAAGPRIPDLIDYRNCTEKGRWV